MENFDQLDINGDENEHARRHVCILDNLPENR